MLGADGFTVAATYARVSTFKQKDGISLDDQASKMLAYAAQNDIQVPDAYRFREAASGLKDEREEYDKIRRLIRERKINALIVYSSDRHTRDPIHGKIFRAELRRSKATLHIVSEGGQVDIYSAQGELMATIKDAFNRYWLDMILQTTYEKKQAYLRQGVPFVQGSVRYGYKRVGKKGEAQAVIDEEVRPIIERIYNWADEGLSINAIERLMEGTVAPGERKAFKLRRRRSRSWGVVAVYRILRDEIYAGVYVANRWETYEDDEGRKRRRERPAEEWIRIEVPAIVSREQWERVQALLDNGQRERPRQHSKYEYLLARRTKCQCGYSVTTIARRSEADPNRQLFYYKCTTQTTRHLVASPCDLPLFRVPECDEHVWELFREVMNNPEVLLAHLSRQQSQQQQTYDADREQLTDVGTLIDEHTAELEVLVMEYARQQARKNTLAGVIREQMERLEQIVAALTARREQLTRRLSRRIISDEEIQGVAQIAKRIRPYLDTTSFQRRRAMIETMGWRFVLQHQDKVYRVIVQWRDWEIPIEVPHPRRGGRQKPQ